MTLHKNESNEQPEVCCMCDDTIEAGSGLLAVDFDVKKWVCNACSKRSAVLYELIALRSYEAMFLSK